MVEALVAVAAGLGLARYALWPLELHLDRRRVASVRARRDALARDLDDSRRNQ